jgi:hypothetical protein
LFSNAIEELLAITQHVGKESEGDPSLHSIIDLEKYYPEAWEVFNQHKRNQYLLGCSE